MLIIPHLLKSYYGYCDSKSYTMSYSKEFLKYLKILIKDGDVLAKALHPNEKLKIKKSYINEKLNFVNIHKTKKNTVEVSFLELKSLLTTLSFKAVSCNVLDRIQKEKNRTLSRDESISVIRNAGHWLSSDFVNNASRETLDIVRTAAKALSYGVPLSMDADTGVCRDLATILVEELYVLKSRIFTILVEHHRIRLEKKDEDRFKNLLEYVEKYLLALMNKNIEEILEIDKILSTILDPKEEYKIPGGSLMRIFTATAACKDRTTCKLGKLASTLFHPVGNKQDKGITSSEISNFVEAYTTRYFNENKPDNDLGVFKIVEGDEIPYYYFLKNNDIKREEDPYASRRRHFELDPMAFIVTGNTEETDRSEDLRPGKLDSSCMRGSPNYLDIYAKNPKTIKMLVKFSNYDTNKIVGRCLLWYAENGSVYFDRIYLKQQKSLKEFYDYLHTNKFINIYSGNKNYTLNNNGAKVSVSLENVEFEKYPYIDSMIYLNLETKKLSNYDVNEDLNIVRVQYTNGGIYSKFGCASIKDHLYHKNKNTLDVATSRIEIFNKSLQNLKNDIAYIPEECKVMDVTEDLIKKYDLISAKSLIDTTLSNDLFLPKSYTDRVFTDSFKNKLRHLINSKDTVHVTKNKIHVDDEF